jgi:spore coat protein U-like protein
LSAGNVANSTVAQRLLAGTAAGNTGTTVAFNLYQSSAAAAPVWGNTPGTDIVSGVGSGSAIPTTVYGRVPAQATPKPGTYQSTITATVNF